MMLHFSWIKTPMDFIKASVKRPKYLALSAASEKAERTSSEDESSQSDGLLGNEVHRTPRQRKVDIFVAVVAVVCALLLSSVGAFLWGMRWRPNLDQQCLEHTSVYSPLMKEMNPELNLVQFNGTLGHKSEFSGDNGDPNPAMDAAWNKWGFVKYWGFSDEQFESMGMDMEGSAKFTEEYGGGYIGFLEVSHKMHCLNVIRQSLHRDYYELPENKHWANWLYDREFTIKIHINHCIEILRQNILCNADVGVIPHHWVEGIPDPFANFNTMHKCRDISSVEKWIEDHTVADPPKDAPYPMPEGSKVWAKPP